MQSPRRFYSSLSLLIVLNVIIKPVWIFAIDRQVQNEIGNSLYGSYFSLLNLSMMGGFLLDWGLTAYLNRELSADRQTTAGPAARFLFLKIGFSLFYILTITGLAAVSGQVNTSILAPVLLTQVLTSFFLFLRGIVTAQQWFRTDAWLSVVDKSLMIGVCGCFLYTPWIAGSISLDKFLWAQAGATFLALLMTLIILLQRGFRFSGKPVLPLKKILSAAFPYALIVMLMTIHYRFDGYFLERVKGPEEAGIYAAAYRILDAANMVGFLAAGFLLPFVARSLQSGDDDKPVVLDVRHGLMIYSLTLVMLFIFLGDWLNILLYPHADNSSTRILQWCLPALIGYSLVQVYGTVLTAKGHILQLCYLGTGALFLNLFLNLILVPSQGAWGSCISAILSQFTFGILCIWQARKKCGQILHPGSVLLYIFIAGMLAGMLYLFRAGGVNPWLQIGLAGFLVTVLSMATGLIRIKRWLDISRSAGS